MDLAEQAALVSQAEQMYPEHVLGHLSLSQITW